ncbi:MULTISPECIES: hypothetical protein [Streptomyces]|uniref:Uncharacterized protein n=2 Tax=Streptomyces TaxID=1883 RepID=A0A3M8FDM7_9ACTN|nr:MULTISPECIES: hypothetical protein [Streptomyces]KNE80861.1 membrane protein [Streptomyces fradiae]OFA55927.1 hypothetical protein BEN35_06335 [Streptomyces fradiae]PQM24954.1 hypothetical protein Sfr7A_01945 [Streptomyces xinghaiensis]RKM99005.1 hypothetical protein SFRA_001945 [Streptomyces xinghaiensis]RNC76092.1 hypothetical protein DC095_002430 [Streptomyces xinghaiensis]
MNIRSLTRGDGVVIGAAVLLFIASFLNYYSVDCEGEFCDQAKKDLPNAWDVDTLLLVLPAVFLLGLIATGLLIAGRFQPQGRKVLGLSLGEWGTGLALAAAWNSVWGLIVTPDGVSVGLGAILALLGGLALAAGALLPSRVPALQASLLGAPKPQAPTPYGAGPGAPAPGGYGYPGGQQQPPQGYGYPGPAGQPGPGGQQPSYGGQPQAGAPAPGPQTGQPPHGGGDFSPFWFAVPVARPLYAEDGSPTPIAELAPGTWYLAVEQRGQALVAQTQDGRRGVLQDTSGIQRG